MITRRGSLPMTKLSAISTAPLALLSKTNKRYLTWRSFILQTQTFLAPNALGPSNVLNFPPNRSLAQVRSEPWSELWFTASFPAKGNTNPQKSGQNSVAQSDPPRPGNDHKPPDERTVRLGETLRTLSPLLPNIFTSPLPNEVLNSSISLHLFPSTHPHLPVVKGRVPCRAALWSAPVAWGSVPIVGNVRVHIVSEKMVRTGFVSAPVMSEEHCDGLGEEKLVVRWKTEDKMNGNTTDTKSPQSVSSSSNEINRGLSTLFGGSQPLFSRGSSEPFTGLFIFSFDKDGKIATMTIEHADENNGTDKTSKVVTLADWLLGKARWGRLEGGLVPGLAYKEIWCRDHLNERVPWRKSGQ